MDNPRPEKVAVVDEVRDKLANTEAVVLTEYRGLTVRDLQDLRKALADAGGEYRVYKNTLVRRAGAELDVDFGDALTGPTALAIVGTRPDGTPGDAVLVAKALKAFAKGNPNLVVKGGRLGGRMLDEAGVNALAEVAPREELLARLAGGLAAPMTNFARLLQALPQNMAYALQALIDKGGAPGAPASAPADDAGAAEGTTEDTEAAEPAVAEATETAADVAGEATEATDDNADTNDTNDTNDNTPAEEAEAAAGEAGDAEE